MSEEINPDSLAVARCIVAAAQGAGYLVEGEPIQSAPELTQLEKPIFINMFKALREHLQTVNRMELTDDEVASMFNFAVGKGAEMAFNFVGNQKLECHVNGLLDSRMSLYVDDRLMNFLKAEPIAAKLGGAFVDFQQENPGSDPILSLFEALKWTMRISSHLTFKFLERQRH